MKILYFILGLLLLPFYPFLKRMQRAMSEKVRIGEKVVVVIRDGKKKKILTN